MTCARYFDYCSCDLGCSPAIHILLIGRTVTVTGQLFVTSMILLAPCCLGTGSSHSLYPCSSDYIYRNRLADLSLLHLFESIPFERRRQTPLDRPVFIDRHTYTYIQMIELQRRLDIAMRTSILLAAFFHTPSCAIPNPIPQVPSVTPPDWSSAPNSTVTCDATSDKIISFYVGPQLGDVLNNACAALMPDCAYPDRHLDLMCITTYDWKLDCPMNTLQSANVESKESGNKLSGWAVQCKSSLRPHISDGTL